MKFKQIILFSSLGILGCTILRTFQIFFAINPETGFFRGRYRDIGFNTTVVIFAVVICTAILGALVKRAPSKMPRVNIFMGLASLAIAAGTAYELITETFVSRIPVWQITLSRVFGLLTVLFFLAYGAKAVYNYRLPRILYITPLLYWIVKLICTFTTISSLSLISDNMLMIAGYCAILVFMLEFAKTANGIDKDWGFKKLLASSLCSLNLCATFSVPRLIAIISGNSKVLHESVSSVLNCFLTGLFILVFTYSFYRNKNLSVHKHHHHHHHRNRFLPGKSGDNFYMGYGEDS